MGTVVGTGVTGACETTLVSQWSHHRLWASFGKYPGSRDACDEEPLLFKQQIQGVPGVHLPQHRSQLDSETSLAQSTGGSSNAPGLPVLSLLMWALSLALTSGMQNTMKEECDKKQQSTLSLTERFAGSQSHFPLPLCRSCPGWTGNTVSA